MATAKKTTAKKDPATNAATKKEATAAKKAPAKKAAAAKSPAAAKKTTTAAKKTNSATSSAASKTASSSKAASAKTVAKKAEPIKTKLDKKFLDQQKAVLLVERARYTQSAITWKAEADSLMESREPGDVQFDEESGEGDSLAVERERDLALSAHARAAIEQIEDALVRIENGTYGVCTGSGKPIPKERLKAIPWASERVEYKVAGFRRR